MSSLLKRKEGKNNKMTCLKTTDKEVYDIITKEMVRQNETIELIASENFVSSAVMEAVGSVLTNKYTEGYPGKRYYGGCQNYDELEKLCQRRWLEVFKCADSYEVNVQPHSGSQANLAAYRAAGLEPGGRLLAMNLNEGGHLSHGSKANVTGDIFNVAFYGINDKGIIDMYEVEKQAKRFKPKVIMCGASAYSREIDFEWFKNIADKVGAVLIADISHYAGLIAAGKYKSPFGYADIVTTTTHKTLRGPRGALIFSKKSLAKKVDSAVFPYLQGGSLQHVIAGKAVAAKECMSEYFELYATNVLRNSIYMASKFRSLGYKIVSGGTECHMFIIDFSKTHPELTGKMVQELLDEHGITVNKNCVPNEKRSPNDASGIRIGLAAMTTKGWTPTNAINCAKKIHEIIDKYYNELKENG